ncbi:testis-expressed protein 10 isoform 3-T3 [Anomaloglossus baeobatrachus]|uniref:testis-expressed protein 10 isoform X3 n=1 Tax=Anomaloglossus baeobatrachus TaxID=238106 RepID=UPI003F4FD429
MGNKRKRQEEFHKVKLKVGKKRPRADNVTDAKCRIKSIRLSEQLREDSLLPSSRRKLTITDVLSQMHHYNAGIKHDALVGLREILSTHPSIIDTHISVIMSEVAAVFTDKDPMVRSAAISVLQRLAPMVSQGKLAPFFPLISAHLSTAMTHIMIGIQEDSLKILDILLEAYPDLLLDRSNMLVNNFLELISHQKSSKELKNPENQSVWTLSVIPNQKITSQRWRINVLSRLKKFLQALMKQAAKRFPKKVLQDNMYKLFSVDKNVDISWIEHANGKQYINLFSSGEECSNSSKFCLSNTDAFLSHNGLDHLLLNVTLCDIMVSLANSSTLQEDSGWLTRIRIFVTENLMSGQLNSKQLKRLLEVTNSLLSIQRNRVSTEKMFQAVYMIYQQRDLQLFVRSMVLTFFNKVYLKDVFLNQGRSRSKVLSCWLSSLPMQLVHLGARNHQLSALIIDTIYIAAARSNKELLQKLQMSACQIYDSKDGFFQHLPEDSQFKLVQLLYFIPLITSNLVECLSQFCISERFSPKLISKLIGIFHARSSFGNWMCSNFETTIFDVDYFSFLFSALIGFSAEQLSWMQSNKITSKVSCTGISPITLFLTDQQFFTHHRKIMQQIVCNSLSSVRPRHQCFDILQNAVTKHLAGLTIVPDSTIGSILHAVNNLLDQSCNPTESFYVFLASSCYSVFNFLLTIEKDVEHVIKRDFLWRECISLLSLMPNVLKLMLQNLQLSQAYQDELPVIAQLLCLLLQNTQLRSHMMTNAFLVQQTLQDVMNLKSSELQEQWLTDLQYCFKIFLTKQIQE